MNLRFLSRASRAICPAEADGQPLTLPADKVAEMQSQVSPSKPKVGFFVSFITPLLMGVVYAIVFTVVDDISDKGAWATISLLSVLWIAAVLAATLLSIKEYLADSQNAFALCGIAVSVIQLFIGLFATPLYFAVWNDVSNVPSL